MNEKTIRNLAIAVVVMMALYGLLRWQQNRSYEPAKPSGFTFKEITGKNTNRIEVKSEKDNYVLVKKDGKWLLNDKEVDKAAIDELFNGLKEAEIEQLAATKNAKMASLQIDDKSGKKVTFSTKNTRNTYIIGKQGLDGASFYIRLPNENKVYLTKGSLGTVFAKKAGDWYDKKETKTKP